MTKSAVSGLAALRLAQRALTALKFQLPPRSTWLANGPTGPRGSVPPKYGLPAGYAGPTYQSQHHSSGIAQSEKQIPRERREVQIIRAVGGRHAAAARPGRGHGQIIVLLQTPTGDCLPINRHRVP